MIYIATTTINKPTKALKLFAKNKNCKLIVSLDKKSKKFHLKNSIVLNTKYQEKKWPRLSKLVGWNCIQRRNFAILEAFERGADYIVVGRPIQNADSPREAAEKIQASIAATL